MRPAEEVAPRLEPPIVLPGEPPTALPPSAAIPMPSDLPPSAADLIIGSQMPYFHRYFRELVFYRGGWVMIEDPAMWQDVRGWVLLNLGPDVGWTWIYIPVNAYYYVYVPRFGGFLHFGYLIAPDTIVILRRIVVERRTPAIIVLPGREGVPRSAPPSPPDVLPAPPRNVPADELGPRPLPDIPRRGEPRSPRPRRTPRPVATPMPTPPVPAPTLAPTPPVPPPPTTRPTPSPRRTARPVPPGVDPGKATPSAPVPGRGRGRTEGEPSAIEASVSADAASSDEPLFRRRVSRVPAFP